MVEVFAANQDGHAPKPPTDEQSRLFTAIEGIFQGCSITASMGIYRSGITDSSHR